VQPKFPLFVAGGDRAACRVTEPLHYHPESRALQLQFDSVRLADRVAEVHVRQLLTDADREFIGWQRMVFVATTDPAVEDQAGLARGVAGRRPGAPGQHRPRFGLRAWYA
jgi:hypothetical protein